MYTYVYNICIYTKAHDTQRPRGENVITGLARSRCGFALFAYLRPRVIYARATPTHTRTHTHARRETTRVHADRCV